jgi:hypothetical protein
MLHTDGNARAKHLREAHGATWAPPGGWRDCIDIEANIGPPSGEPRKKTGAAAGAEAPARGSCRLLAMHPQIVEAGERLTRRYVTSGSHYLAMRTGQQYAREPNETMEC